MSTDLGGLWDVLAEALRGCGLTDDPANYDSDIHSWRCSHPDIYGPCSCFREVIEDVEAAILAHLADVLASEDVRGEVRSAVANTVCRCDDGLGGIVCATCDADAALTTIRAALGITADESREESGR